MMTTFAVLLQITAQSQPLTALQQESFRKEVERLMRTYGDQASLTADGASIDQGMVSALKGTFIETQKAVVFNDLLPPKTEGDRYLSPVAYTQYVYKNYPEGLDVQFRVEDITMEPMPVKGKYTAVVRATKKIRGFYGGKRIHSYSGTLYFYVQTNFAGDRPQGAGISLVADPDKHAQLQSNRSMGGLYAGLSGVYSQSLLFNPAIFSSSTWQTSMGQGISPSIEVYYMITKGFGIGTGLRLGGYSTTLSLDGYDKQLTSTVTDADGDAYNPIYNIPHLEELSSIRTMDIPICLKFRAGKGKTGFYFDVGAVYSTFRKATYTLSGTATLKGYYQAYSVTLENIPEYSFTTTVFESEEKAMATPSSSISSFVSLGLTVMVHQDITLRLGVTSSFGLTDLLYTESRHPFDFYATTGLPGEKTNLLSAGVELGVYYRILAGK